MKTTIVWVLGILCLVLFVALLVPPLFEADESDMLAASSMAETGGWTAVHLAEVNSRHDIEVVRSQIIPDTHTSQGTLVVEVCDYTSRIGNSPRGGDCHQIIAIQVIQPLK